VNLGLEKEVLFFSWRYDVSRDKKETALYHILLAQNKSFILGKKYPLLSLFWIESTQNRDKDF
jgi:hypothetical protein